MKKRPRILTLSGLDPSNGAGMGADIKTIEALKCFAFSVCTANTVQNDVTLLSSYWINLEVMKSQIKLLFSRFDIGYVKIGIVQNWLILNELIDYLLLYNTEITIVLDPILTSSSDFSFHDTVNQKDDLKNSFEKVLDKIHLLTPNYHEIQQLYPDKSTKQSIEHITAKTHLFLKGGHRLKHKGTDELLIKQGDIHVFKPRVKNISEKHGSGCVLSSAICSYLALGYSLVQACDEGKRYTEKVLKSNTTLLGYHG